MEHRAFTVGSLRRMHNIARNGMDHRRRKRLLRERGGGTAVRIVAVHTIYIPVSAVYCLDGIHRTFRKRRRERIGRSARLHHLAVHLKADQRTRRDVCRRHGDFVRRRDDVRTKACTGNRHAAALSVENRDGQRRLVPDRAKPHFAVMKNRHAPVDVGCHHTSGGGIQVRRVRTRVNCGRERTEAVVSRICVGKKRIVDGLAVEPGG